MSRPRALPVDRGILVGIATTFLALGISVNVVVLERVGSPLRTFVAAIVVNAATTELAYLAVRDAGGSIVAALIAGWVVASRFGLLAAGLGARANIGTVHRAAAALQSFDPNVGLAIQQRDSATVMSVFWRVTLAMHLGWWTGTGIGVLLGNALGDTQRLGLDVVFPAAMLAIIANLLRERSGAAAAALGAIFCLALLPVAPAGVPIVVSVLGAVVALAIPQGSTP